MSYASYLSNRLASLFHRLPADKLAQLDSALDDADPSQVHGIAVKSLSDVRVDTSQPDMWNRSDSGMKMHGIASGPSEAASGDGAFKMVPEYSTFAAQSALVTAYDSLSKRMEGLESAVKSIAQYIAKANGEQAFPHDSHGCNGGSDAEPDEDTTRPNGKMNTAKADTDDEDEQAEEEQTAKALRGDATLSMDVRGLMNKLMRKTDQANRRVVSPPSFMKAETGRTRSFDDALVDVRDDSLTYDTEDSIRVASLRNAIALFNSGAIDSKAFAMAKSRAGTKAREALGLEAA